MYRWRRLWVLLALSSAACGGSPDATAPGSDPPPVSTDRGSGPAGLVDPLIGTGYAQSPDPVGGGKGGATFPGATLPFGMVQWSPDTPAASPEGYLYDDDKIVDFSLTHLDGAGCSGERDFPIFATLGAPDVMLDPSDGFSHDDEIASPGFYEVKLASGIQVDITATARTGFARFAFPDADGHISIASGMSKDRLFSQAFDLEVAGKDTVTGSRITQMFCLAAASYHIYFAARFDRPIASATPWDGGELQPGQSQVSTTNGGLSLGFDTSRRRVVQMKVGLSYTSVEEAKANLDAENPGWDFDAVHQAAIDAWNGYLGRVEIEGGSDADRTSFYTALYHSFLQPVTFNDVDGSFPGFDGKPYKVAQGSTRYATFSGWDIYRSWIHLVSVLAPTQASDMVRSLVDAGGECGALPKWALANDETAVMVGDPADGIIAGAWAFGARDFDTSKALALMLKGANQVGAACNGHVARPGLKAYLDRHYCPMDDPDAPQGPPSTTEEYSVADFAIAQFAKAQGDAVNAATFLDRGSWWKNVYDPSLTERGFTGYVQPRLASGVFQNVAVDSRTGFVEGNSTQYTFFPTQDVPGLITAVGGDAMLIARLDDLFTELNAGVGHPYFYMGNEPEFGTPWEYAFAGAPWRTQAVVRRILTEVFTPKPDGLPGNDDLGATSAWQAWAMLGLYPEVPGVGGLVVGSPTFPKATIHLENGKSIVITADGAAPDAPYVQSLAVDGKPTTSTWLTWDQLKDGATLDFVLGKNGNKAFGSAPADRPPSFYP